MSFISMLGAWAPGASTLKNDNARVEPGAVVGNRYQSNHRIWRRVAVNWQGRRRQACPACDRGPRDTALNITENPDGSMVAFCHRCRFTATTRGEHRHGKVPRRHVVSATRHETLSDHGHRLWRECQPLAGVALAYLEARACVIPPADGDLRYHPALRHPKTGYVGPTLVALLTDAVDARIARTLHRTWICTDGTKAPQADPPRLLLGGHRKAGAVCRLWPDEAVTYGLGIGEGIETALSLAHGMTPVWSAIDASNLADFPLLDRIEAITVAADHEPTGVKAARECAQRWADAKREARVVMPEQRGADLNDLTRGPHERA